MKLYTYYRILIASAATLWITTACSDLLDLENPNSLTSSTAFSTEADINSSLTGIYHSFYSSYYAMMSSNQFSGQSDEMTSYSTADLQQYIKHVYSNMNQLWNSTTWNQLYEQIARCNQVITYAENITEWNTYDKEQILAQAKAIRAYDYYQLVMLYQIPPYVDYVATADDQPEAGDFDEICQKIIDDAKYAYEILPASYKSSEGYNGCAEWTGQYRVTKWFAASVIAKTYMNWGNYLSGGYRYEEALPYYKDIVENGNFTLTSDYTDNFNIGSSYENNSESIFEIQNEASSYGWENYYGDTNNYTVPSQSMWRWKFYSAGPLGWSDYNSEAWILYAFKNEKAKNGQNGSEWDARIPATIFYSDIFTDFPNHVQWQTWTATQGQASSSAEISTETPGFSYSDWVSTRVYINKYTAQYENWVTVNSDNSEGTNNRIFRLGEIMLDYAECLAQTGELQEAVKIINKVRNRAGLCDLGERQNYKVESIYLNSETGQTSDFNTEYGYAAFENNSGSYTLDDIMAVLDIETMKESAFECERLIDLRRWGISYNSSFLEKVKKRSYKYYANFTSVRAWLPMPTDDVNNNPNLSQLPGW